MRERGAKYVTKDLNVTLIVDGGPENHNFTINDFINRSEINIRKLTALKDINSSNSMVERVNRTLKYRYIFPKEPRDLKHLKRILNYFIQDYNFTKPHGQLSGLTPNECYNGIKPLKAHKTELVIRAKAKRLEENKKNRCERCK